MTDNKQFTATVDKWVLETRQRMIAVFRTAAQYVIEDVRNRTPVDTGYARASWTVTLDAPLPMRGTRGDGYQAPSYSLVIAGADLGSTIYLSAVANYLGHLEYGARGRAGVGMVRLASQAWQQHVNRATAEAQSRVAANVRGS